MVGAGGGVKKIRYQIITTNVSLRYHKSGLPDSGAELTKIATAEKHQLRPPDSAQKLSIEFVAGSAPGKQGTPIQE
jgi:hypothetical protein